MQPAVRCISEISPSPSRPLSPPHWFVCAAAMCVYTHVCVCVCFLRARNGGGTPLQQQDDSLQECSMNQSSLAVSPTTPTESDAQAAAQQSFSLHALLPCVFVQHCSNMCACLVCTEAMVASIVCCLSLASRRPIVERKREDCVRPPRAVDAKQLPTPSGGNHRTCSNMSQRVNTLQLFTQGVVAERSRSRGCGHCCWPTAAVQGHQVRRSCCRCWGHLIAAQLCLCCCRVLSCHSAAAVCCSWPGCEVGMVCVACCWVGCCLHQRLG